MYNEKDFSDFRNIPIEKPFSFTERSSIGCGGYAKIAFYPTSIAETVSLLRRLDDKNVPYAVVGNMTNILPADEGTEKVVVCTKKFIGANFNDKSYVSSGLSAGAFLRACRYAKKGGGEFLAGIPCTLGGALYMNAGAAGVYISEIVESVLVYKDGDLQTIEKEKCGYSYKNSRFMRTGEVILGATLQLYDSDEKGIDERKKAFLSKRAHLPTGKSMGCVFKNPDGTTAGALIEKAGLKGMRVGGAVVSEMHANFIINDKNATASDVRALITIIKNAVFAQYAVALEEEIQYLS